MSTAEPTSAEPSDSLKVSTAEPTSAEPSGGLKISTAQPTSVEPLTLQSVPVEPDTTTSSTTKTTFREPVSAVATASSSLAFAKNTTSIPGWKVKNACGFPLRVLYYVHTAPNNFHMRQFLRYSIGNPAVATFVNSSIAFFVGKTTNTELREELHAEAECEGDLVLLDHVDTYRDLTLKFIGATKWLAANGCLSSSTDVIVKMDDDVIVNAFLLASYIKRRMAATKTRNLETIHCAIMPPVYLKPMRSKKSKWFVTEEEYDNDIYPPFCSGAAYLMKASVLALLGKATGSVPFFWVDDVYATGLLRMAQNVTLVNITRMYSIVPSYRTTSISNKTLFFHWGQTPRLFKRAYRLWASVLRQYLNM
ncbi:beta-1,3-galactosyltransferase 5 [Rhipicephalus sanguineus]|nr:beta-1,3-galactosyltransferase 5 [Rhipicephalus sanguineus]